MATPVSIERARREGHGEFHLPRRDKASLETALGVLGLQVRYNLRTKGHEWNESAGWIPANDRLDDDLRERIAARFTIGKNHVPALYARERWSTSLNAVLHGCEVDPFRQWLESLSAWDGTERLSLWLGQAFMTPDDALSRWVSRYVFLGAVERAHKPGCKLDVMPVLVGPQGCGKSTALARMFPHDAPPDWFRDNLSLAADPKARAEALQGAVVVEVSEMVGSTRVELQALKAFLSRTDDGGGVRLAYRRNPEVQLRRCILVGTSNEAECLPNDWTGNRRFLAVEVEPGLRGVAGVRTLLDDWREQLWAEALHLHRQGVEARLPDDLARDQAAANERHRAADTILEDALESWIGTGQDVFTLRQAAEGCRLVEPGVTVSGGNQTKLRGLLRKAGYKPDENARRVNGVRAHWWRREIA